jgi:hypothetical protein
MASIIKIRKNDTAGVVPSSLQEGELAVNLKDRILYTANSTVVFELARNTANNGLVLTDPGGNTISLVAPTGIDANYTLTLPENDGDASQFLQTDGSGVLSWAAGSAPADATITLAAGSGLTDGGDFTTNQSSPETITFNVGAGDGITVAADSVAVDGANGILVTTDGVNVQAADATISVAAGGIAAVPGQIDHDSLSNFVANEHVDHSTVNIDSGAGLTGGGDITATRTLAVGQANGIIVDADSIQVNGANGILVTTAGVNVQAADATISVVAGGISVDESQLQIPTSSITSGNYVATITAGAGLTGDATTNGATPTISVNVGEGIAITSDAVALKNAASLSDNTVAKWDDTNTQFINSSITDDGTTVTIGGNLTVNGTTTTIESTTVTIDDSLLKFANGNVADTVDIGWYGQFDEGSGKRYSGIFRDASDATGPNSTNVFKVWTNLTAEPGTTFNLGTGELAQLDAVIDGGSF